MSPTGEPDELLLLPPLLLLLPLLLLVPAAVPPPPLVPFESSGGGLFSEGARGGNGCGLSSAPESLSCEQACTVCRTANAAANHSTL